MGTVNKEVVKKMTPNINETLILCGYCECLVKDDTCHLPDCPYSTDGYEKVDIWDVTELDVRE